MKIRPQKGYIFNHITVSIVMTESAKAESLSQKLNTFYCWSISMAREQRAHLISIRVRNIYKENAKSILLDSKCTFGQKKMQLGIRTYANNNK